MICSKYVQILGGVHADIDSWWHFKQLGVFLWSLVLGLSLNFCAYVHVYVCHECLKIKVVGVCVSFDQTLTRYIICQSETYKLTHKYLHLSRIWQQIASALFRNLPQKCHSVPDLVMKLFGFEICRHRWLTSCRSPARSGWSPIPRSS